MKHGQFIHSRMNSKDLLNTVLHRLFRKIEKRLLPTDRAKSKVEVTKMRL